MLSDDCCAVFSFGFKTAGPRSACVMGAGSSAPTLEKIGPGSTWEPATRNPQSPKVNIPQDPTVGGPSLFCIDIGDSICPVTVLAQEAGPRYGGPQPS